MMGTDLTRLAESSQGLFLMPSAISALVGGVVLLVLMLSVPVAATGLTVCFVIVYFNRKVGFVTKKAEALSLKGTDERVATLKQLIEHNEKQLAAQQPGDRRSHVPCCIPDALVKAWRASPRGWRRHEKRRGAADGREGPRHVPRPVKAPSVVHDGDAAGDERVEDRATRRRVCPHGDGTRVFQRGLWDVMVAERLGFESQGGYRQTA